MLTEGLVFEIIIEGTPYGFFLEPAPEGRVYLTLPDAGGQADMVPKYPAQLQWIEAKVANIKSLNRIWPTIWEITSREVLENIKQLLLKFGKLSSKPKSTYYAVNQAG